MLADVKDPVRLLRRIAVTVVGTVILAVGVVLLVAPGPGLVVIALALAVFAIEYQWARRNLAAVQERARSAALKAAASRVATASAVLFGVGAIGLGVVLIFTELLPLSGAGTGGRAWRTPAAEATGWPRQWARPSSPARTPAWKREPASSAAISSATRRR
jgi:uncharacterized protein (TIGR02611 family)